MECAFLGSYSVLEGNIPKKGFGCLGWISWGGRGFGDGTFGFSLRLYWCEWGG